MTAPEPLVREEFTSRAVTSYTYPLVPPLEGASREAGMDGYRGVARWRFTSLRVTYLHTVTVQGDTHVERCLMDVEGTGTNVLSSGQSGSIQALGHVLARVDRREGLAEAEPWCAEVVGPILADAAARRAADLAGGAR